METKKACLKVLETSNYSTLKDLSVFVKSYIEKLVYNIMMYVDNDITVGSIEIADKFSGKCELSQEILGVPSAMTGIDGRADTLAAFAEKYSHLGIKEFDMLAKEAILDFLNLNNGLFVVLLSKNDICELTLNVPKQNGNYALDLALYKSITIIPIIFRYGTIKFYLCEG